MSCGGSVCSLFSDIVFSGSTLNGSCLYFRSGNGGFCFFEDEFVVLICSPFFFYELLCYNVCNLYPHKFLQVYHYQHNLLYVLCLWNASFWVDFRIVYNFHRCFFLKISFQLTLGWSIWKLYPFMYRSLNHLSDCS